MCISVLHMNQLDVLKHNTKLLTKRRDIQTVIIQFHAGMQPLVIV